MGKGDLKSRRGKIYRGSFGKRRPRKKAKHIAAVPVVEKVKKEETSIAEIKPEIEKKEKAVVEEKKTKKSRSSKKGTPE